MDLIIVTGVGNKTITKEGIDRIKNVATIMNSLGFILRSGACAGSDSAFEECFDKSEIYLPKKGHNDHPSNLYQIGKEAFELAAKIHPHYWQMKGFSKKLHARNCQQVLGKDLDRPSDILVCWTRDGAYSKETSSLETGGTRTAIVLADMNNIPVYNIKNDDMYNELISKLKLLRDSSSSFKEIFLSKY